MAKSNQPDGFLTQQPCDWYEDKIKFPCIVQPKIDGVASYNRHGNLLGRSLKPHENKFVTSQWQGEQFHGFCGEMTVGDNPTLADLCRITSGDLRRHTGEPDTTWWLFDYCTEKTKNLEYTQRIGLLREAVDDCGYMRSTIRIIESVLVENMDQLLELEAKYLDMGYEGIIIRDPKAPFKYGRCGKTFMGAWRVKRFIDAEIRVESFEEGRSNQNEAKVNERGRTERSTVAENMIPNGQVGSFSGPLLADVLDPQTNKVLIEKGTIIKVSPGEFPVDQRKAMFEDQTLYLNRILKFKLFPKGIKDKPRFPVAISFRNENDL